MQGSIYSALCCETKWMNLTSPFWILAFAFYGGSELSKHLSKCLPRMRKTQKNRTRYNFFFDGQKFRRQCANVIDITWGRIYFSTCENFGRKIRTQCAMAFSPKMKTLVIYSTSCWSNPWKFVHLRNTNEDINQNLTSFCTSTESLFTQNVDASKHS